MKWEPGLEKTIIYLGIRLSNDGQTIPRMLLFRKNMRKQKTPCPDSKCMHEMSKLTEFISEGYMFEAWLRPSNAIIDS